jgi:acyl dehydratase
MSENWTVSTKSVGAFTIARTYEVTVRMAQAYAAGVGDWNPLYFHDDASDSVFAPPCLVYRLQWNARHMPGVWLGTVPPTQGVHSSTDLRFERPLRVGDVLTVQGRRVAMRQLKPGVEVIDRYEVRDGRGVLVATMHEGSILRGAQVDGPDVSLEEISAPPAVDGSETGGWSAAVPIAREAPHLYTECADIWNPIHTERKVALAAGLPDIIFQGSAIAAIAARELTNRVGHGDPSQLKRLVGQFRAMVVPGSDIAVECTGVRTSSAGRLAAFFEVKNERAGPAIKNGVALFEV